MDEKIKKIASNLQLGEGCIWDEERKAIHFVDIEAFKIYSYSLEKGHMKEYNTGDYVGSMVLDKKGHLIAAVKNKIVRINLDNESMETILTIDQPEYVRFNDGKCDCHGNLWVGTMAIDQNHPKVIGAGKLYCISNEEIIATYDGFTIPNGLAWNKEGNKFYHIDTKTQSIQEYDVEEPGVISNKRTLVNIDYMEGSPDGMTIDTEGRLWVAMWGGSKVNCYDSHTGEKLGEIKVPSMNTSCCTFGGEKLDTLYVTSAKEDENNLGGLYEVKISEIRGTLPYRYGKVD